VSSPNEWTVLSPPGGTDRGGIRNHRLWKLNPAAPSPVEARRRRRSLTSSPLLERWSALSVFTVPPSPCPNSCDYRWMNGQHLRARPSQEVTQFIGDRWKASDLFIVSAGPFVD
ncbi:hypothetical protein HN51_059372, partial [Arachis hypogaea]